MSIAVRTHPTSRRLVACLVLGLLTGSLDTPPASAADPFAPVGTDQIAVRGEIGRRVDITMQNNLLKLDVDGDFLRPFQVKERKNGYIGLGKLIDAAVRFSVYSGDKNVIALKEHLVDTVIRAQEPDGYIGMFTKDQRVTALWDFHEMGYLVYGLSIDYQYFKHPRSLQAARKAADYIVRHWPQIPDDWGQRTGVATHVAVTGLERGMIVLGQLTGDAKYVDFCRHERALPEWDLGIVIGRRPLIEGHIYAYLCRCLAQLELYRALPDERLLQQSKRTFDFLTHGNGMTITGGCGQWECWTDDQEGRTALAETCATAYQVRLADRLLQLTGESRFGDLMERTIYNSLFAAQSPDGRRIRYYTPFEGPRKYHPGDSYCCPGNYRRIVAELPGMIYYRSQGGVAINLYTASDAKLPLADGTVVALRQETDYPNSGRIVVHIDPPVPRKFPLRVRIPAWCDSAQVSVNDGLAADAPGGAFYCVDRTWKIGDRVVVRIPMNWRLVRGRQRQAGRVAVMRGPLLFCLDPAQHPQLADRDAADLGQIVLDPKSLGAPVPDDSVRPDGLACPLEAWQPGYRCKRPGDLKLKLTEFADPGGRAVYFRLRDPSPAVDDVLFLQAGG
ncbi:MAG: beta-L-arabinofuranosidase domain-containing protein [Pirellulales bacterium]